MQIDQNNSITENTPNMNNPFPNVQSEKKTKNNLLMVFLGLFVSALVIVGYLWVNNANDGSLLSPTGKELPLEEGVIPDDMYLSPLTGELYDAETEKEVRPLGVMINNHVSARPQSGLIEADLVYEVVAEGGITRFLAFFNSSVPDKIGPVRSTREYYLVLVKELGDAMLMHIGWSPQALTAIETWPVRSLARGGAQFWRDQDRLNAGVATEHTAYVSGPDLLELGDSLGWEGTRDFDVYEFKDDALVGNGGTATGDCKIGECSPITIDFWFSGDYSAIWEYDRESNTYLRSMDYDDEGNAIPHKDQETGEQISVNNLIVQFAAESPIVGDDKGRLEYELIGSGEGIVFIDGEAKQVTWSKETRDSRTKYFDNTNGEEIAFNRGQFWIAIVPDRNVEQVTYTQ